MLGAHESDPSTIRQLVGFSETIATLRKEGGPLHGKGVPFLPFETVLRSAELHALADGTMSLQDCISQSGWPFELFTMDSKQRQILDSVMKQFFGGKGERTLEKMQV